jgi:hypothetical protein
VIASRFHTLIVAGDWNGSTIPGSSKYPVTSFQTCTGDAGVADAGDRRGQGERGPLDISEQLGGFPPRAPAIETSLVLTGLAGVAVVHAWTEGTPVSCEARMLTNS